MSNLLQIVVCLGLIYAASAQTGLCHTKRGTISGGAEDGAPCQCALTASDGCNFCEFQDGVDLGCSRCRDSKFLLENVCVQTCPEGYVTIDQGNFGSECRKVGFTCTDGVDDKGRICNCDGECTSCQVDETGYICTDCSKATILVDGKCYDNIKCEGKNFILDGVPTNTACDCGETGSRMCKKCVTLVTHDLETDSRVLTHKCRSCRAGHFLHNAWCRHKDTGCPEGHVPYGVHSNFGRLCLNSTSQCRKDKFVTGDDNIVGRACRCPDISCRDCTFSPENGQVGEQCTKCRRPKFLHDGTCVDSCPEGFVKLGRSCVEPYTCELGKTIDGQQCSCPGDCTKCLREFGQDTCLGCHNDLFLTENDCKKKCSGGLVEYIPKGANGRECREPTTDAPTTPKATTTVPTTKATTSTTAVPTSTTAATTTTSTTTTATTTTPTTTTTTTTTDPTPTAIPCEDTTDKHATFACESCDGHHGFFYPIRQHSHIDHLVRSPYGRMKIRGLMDTLPTKYFDGKPATVGILLTGNYTDETGRETESLCLSFLPEMGPLDAQLTFARLYGLDFGDVAKLPDGFSDGNGNDPFSNFSPGDFNFPLQFDVNQEKELARRETAPDEQTKKDVGVRWELSNILDSFVNSRRGLMSIMLPQFDIGGNEPLSQSYLKLMFVGVGWRPPPELTLGNSISAMCSSCASVITSIDEMTKLATWGPLVKILDSLLNFRLHFVALTADNGYRLQFGLMNLLTSSTLNCGVASGNRGCAQYKGNGRVSPSGSFFKDRWNDIKYFVQSWYPNRLTFDFWLDFSFTTADEPLDIFGWKIDGFNVRVELINIFNQLDVKRDYCRQSYNDRFGGYSGTNFDFEPPRERTTNLEIAASWFLGGTFPLEIALRRERWTKTATISQSRTCTGFNPDFATRADNTQKQDARKDIWLFIVRFPRISVKQAICLSQGVNPGVSSDNMELDGEAQKCNELFSNMMHWVPATILDLLTDLALDAPRLYGGRKGPLVSPNGEYFGPQFTIQLTGKDPRDWIYQFQGLLVVFGLPFTPLDIKLSRSGSVYDSANIDSSSPIAGGPRPRRRAAAGAPTLLAGFEFTSRDMSALIKEIIDVDFVETAVNAIAGTVEGAIGFVVSSQPINVLATPEFALDLECLQGMPYVPQGLTVAMSMTYPEDCDNLICNFIRKYLGRPKIHLYANIKPQPAGLSMGGSISNIILVRDKCAGPVGTMYELGRPVFELTSVGVFTDATVEGIVLGFRAFLTLDVGNIRSNDNEDFCDYMPQSDTEAYKWMEPLTFLIMIEVQPTGLYMGGAMIGIWTRAFGLDFFHFGNLQLGIGITAALGLPAFELGGEITLGYNCYIPNEETGGLIEDGNAGCVGGAAYVGFDPANPNGNYIYMGLRQLTLKNLMKLFLPSDIRFDLPATLENSGFVAKLRDDNTTIPNPEISFTTAPFGAMTLAGRYIPGGFFFNGDFTFLDFNVKANIILNPIQQIKLNATMDPIVVGDDLLVISKSSSDKSSGPLLDIDIQYGLLSLIPSVDITIAGYMNALGISKEVQMRVSTSGFEVFVEDKFLGLYESAMNISADLGSVKTANFMVAASMKRDFLSKLRAETEKILKQASDTATSAIGSAQDEVNAAKADVEEANGAFDDAVSAIQDARDAVANADAALEAAAAAVTNAQDDVDAQRAKFEAAADWLRSKNAELESAKGKFDAAANAVASKQRDVDSAEATLNSAKNTLTQKQNELNNAKKAFDDASAEVQKAQDKVDAERKKLNAAKATLSQKQTEFNNAKKAYDDAAAAVRSKQNDVNSKKKNFDDAVDSLNSAKKSCQDKMSEVSKACACGQVCTPWGPCFCSNPLYHTCGALQAVANSLCNTVDVATGTVNAAKYSLDVANAALEAAAVVAENSKWTMDVASAALEVAKAGVTAAEGPFYIAIGALETAQQTVNAAKYSVDVAQAAFDLAKLAVTGATESLNVARGALAAAEAVVRESQIVVDAAQGAVDLAADGVEASQGVLDLAILALEGAKKVLEQKELLKAAADAALSAAQTVVDEARVVLDIAQGVLDVANGALEGVKQTVKAGLAVANAIAQFALGGLVDVIGCSFKVELSSAYGGAFEASVTARFLDGEPETLSLRVNFKDVIETAIDLAEKAFEGVKDFVTAPF